MASNIFGTFDELEKRITAIEKKLEKLEVSSQFETSLLRSHLVRIKNNEDLDDDFIMRAAKYNDLSPGEAVSLFSDIDANYVMLDVSAKDFTPKRKYESSIKIPLEQLVARVSEISSFKHAYLIVISENGLRSIKACEMLIELGYYNLNNISGGHEHLDSVIGV